MQRHVVRTAVWAAALATCAAACPGQVTEREIDEAIRRGVENVFSQQNADGRWGQYDWAGGHHYPWGRDAIALMVLEFAKVPVNDPRYQKGLKQFLEVDPEQNYERCCRTIVLAQLTRRTKGAQQAGFRRRLLEDVRWIQEAQGDDGGWTYTSRHGGPGFHDFSNSQFAVLALSEAIMAGVEVSAQTMKKAQDLFLGAQRPDGGWNYSVRDQKNPSYGGMTAAAVATLFITRDYLHPQVGCPCRGNRSPRRKTVADQAIKTGIQWLAAKFVPNKNPDFTDGWWARYWLYSVARVGVASGYKYLGTHNWYREGAQSAVRWTVGQGQSFPQGCLATLFLIKGRAPLLYNKLQWDGDWNLHPRDLSNLTDFIGKLKEQPVGWQIVPLEAPLAEWLEAPILYISAEEKIELTDEQGEKLRRYAGAGGTILFEASCGNRSAETWWRNTCKKLWPEYEFQRVGPEHPLWTADAKIQGRVLPMLDGLSDGLRTFVFLAPRDISCKWNTRAAARYEPYLLLGGNLYMYATDKRPLRAMFADKPQAAADAYGGANLRCGAKGELAIARLKTAGDYYLGTPYRPLARYNDLRHRAAPQLLIADPVEPTDPKLNDLDVVWLTGRKDASLSDEAAGGLKAFLAAGGFLLAEATLGDERFAASFRKTAQLMGLQMKTVSKDDPLLTGRLEGAAGFDLSKVRFATHLKVKRIGLSTPLVEGIYLDGKLVGVFSPFDLLFSQTGCKAYGNLGYEPDDARAVATNILLLATCQRAKRTP